MPFPRFPKSPLSCAVAAVAVGATLVLASPATLAADSGAARADAEAAAERITVGGCESPDGGFAAAESTGERSGTNHPIPIEVDDARLIAVTTFEAPAGDAGVAAEPDVVDPADALKREYLACEAAAMERLLGAGDAARCSQVYEALLRSAFGGRYEDLHAWWKDSTQAP